MELSRKILWGSAGIVLVAVIFVSVSSDKTSKEASLIPELKSGSSSLGSSEKIIWASSAPAEVFLTESEARGTPFVVKDERKVVCNARGRFLGGGSVPLEENEQPNHLVVDFENETTTQCVKSNCKTVSVKFQNLDGTPVTILPIEIKEALNVQLYTEGKYRDFEPDGTYYYGSCLPG
ncbi:hypothetical protein A3J34_01840 [Candidatus Peribacteria bacterium RIFCSPLOWO2_02_FULL_51_10]|nr:MAG: hypothetical protein A3C52_01710 [Candidatus Peribacteria bacterium RIFCSPHIGHO2_02_FULL_51_15]OGJ68921.1 MAG: hypothetical protein A3J34_01840 [Candidatus Peribacteria bacterium RIFCSPLOWO2_02_FULL_51_10]